MGRSKKVYSHIHHHTDVDLSRYLYTQMYVGTNGCSGTINGVTNTFSKCTKINLVLRTLSDSSGDLYFLGIAKHGFKSITYSSGFYYLITHDGEIITTDDDSLFTYVD